MSDPEADESPSPETTETEKEGTEAPFPGPTGSTGTDVEGDENPYPSAG
jgi:hypothetical protein